MSSNPFPFKGLTTQEVTNAVRKAGTVNHADNKTGSWRSVLKTVLDPVFLLLVIAAIIYASLHQFAEAITMVIAVGIITSIGITQETRSRNALAALEKLTARKARVIRNNRLADIDATAVVIGDYLVAEEGTLLAADGRLVHAHDFAVNEASLTGESAIVYKSADHDVVYQGTAIVSGLGVYVVTATGESTQMGRVRASLKMIRQEKSPLELQIHRFVTVMSLVGGAVFLLVWGISFFRSGEWIDSLLKALTLAMSILPEEIPVAFSTFMALGAWRLMQQGILAKDVKTVEALGAATVICLDKTGTITQNSMVLKEVILPGEDHSRDKDQWNSDAVRKLLAVAMWASEPVPFDPMEKSLHELYGKLAGNDERKLYTMEKEYPLAGKPPMMTHVFSDTSGSRILAVKGAPEHVLLNCHLKAEELEKINAQVAGSTAQGYRVLAVAEGRWGGRELPSTQDEIPLHFLGIISFYDPPRPGIHHLFETFYDAGIDVKIITGDNAQTAAAIAGQAGLAPSGHHMSGDDTLVLTDEALKERINQVNLFTRMFPEAKLRVIKILKSLGHIVAMTGDGVNDALALKSAHIGIAMGKHGSETARETASLVLLEDDLGKMPLAIAIGRQIYINLKKAIGYIIAIHIPIILIVTLPLLLNWLYPSIFSPVHVVFLELIMGPTCSIVYENEPMEAGLMRLKPRNVATGLLTFRELSRSILQGLIITAGVLSLYRAGVAMNYPEGLVRSQVFLALISANIFLTLVNRSADLSLLQTLRYKNKLLSFILAITVILVGGIFGIPFFRGLFHFSSPGFWQVVVAIGVGLLSVIWMEIVKYFSRMHRKAA